MMVDVMVLNAEHCCSFENSFLKTNWYSQLGQAAPQMSRKVERS